MKIIHSFWSGNNKEILTHNYAWLKPEYHWLSWILSAHQISKFYPIELYTDSTGYEILIKKLQLPYTKVHVVLDELNHYHPSLWALPKIKAYSLQKEPFLHVDGDVFIWDRFPEELLKQELITQNLEITTKYYGEMWKEIYPHLEYTPNEMSSYIDGSSQYACNMGITGGTDLEFYKYYTEKSFEFVDKNKAVWNQINGFNFNIFFEQVLFYECAKEKNKNVSHLFQEVSKDNEYKGLASFEKTPEKSYLHLLGFYKKDFHVCKQMENYVLTQYPESFERLVSLSNEYYKTFRTNLPNFSISKHNVQQVKDTFDPSVERSEKADPSYLLGRDLASVGLPQKFRARLSNGGNPELIKLKGWTFEPTDVPGFEYKAILEETDDFKAVHPMDHIDEFILEDLEYPIRYFDLKSIMEDQLDESAMEIKDRFLTMIDDRIHYFITQRILSYRP